jgi:hypothetical protein
MNREQKREKLNDVVASMFERFPDRYAGDDTTAIIRDYISITYDGYLTEEMIKAIHSVDRARRKYLQNHPELDRRSRAKELQKEDRLYYANA